jgi:hypothetical protein
VPKYINSRNGKGEWTLTGVFLEGNPACESPRAGIADFSEDVSQAIVWAEEDALSPGGPTSASEVGYYIWSMATDSYRLLAPIKKEVSEFGYFSLAGFSSNDSRLSFESEEALAPGTITGAPNVYEVDLEKPVAEQLTVVSLIPPEGDASCGPSGPACVSPAGGATAGASALRDFAESENVISQDGSRVFFTAEPSGRIYVRENETSTHTVSAGKAQFLTATPDGEYVLYTEEGDLYRYDVGTNHGEELTSGSAGVLGLLGASNNGSTAYFAATAVLAANSRTTTATGSGDLTAASHEVASLAPSSNGSFFAVGEEIAGEGIPAHTIITAVDVNATTHAPDALQLSTAAEASASNVALTAVASEAAANEPGNANLYEWQEGHTELTFLARVINGAQIDEPNWRKELGGSFPNNTKTSRVTADGETLMFTSHRSLTGYENNGVQEVYRYRAGTGGALGRLVCVSCDPTGTAPLGEALLAGKATGLRYGTENTLARNLSESGDRIFFETPDPLASADTNTGDNPSCVPEGSMAVTGCDVYEWETAGEGTCEAESEDGGCLFLISGGEKGEAYLLDSSTTGDDVFFITRTELTTSEQEEGPATVYDASVDGGGGVAVKCGEPEAETCPPPKCETAENCKPARTTFPTEAPFGTGTFTGPGDVTETIGPPPPHCKTGAHLSHGKCVAVSPPKKCKKGRHLRNGKCVAIHKKRKPAQTKVTGRRGHK